jgi:hypothetical protein
MTFKRTKVVLCRNVDTAPDTPGNQQGHILMLQDYNWFGLHKVGDQYESGPYEGPCPPQYPTGHQPVSTKPVWIDRRHLQQER